MVRLLANGSNANFVQTLFPWALADTETLLSGSDVTNPDF